MMLYIKALTLDHFKSFKHANLLFSKGFTAIVGPNGSGKSNICDALLFCLGENSLHRLRANRLEDLITNQGKKGSLSKAFVKIELAGDESIEITRIVRSDGKSAYRVNGKHMTRQEVIELLGSHRMFADERNTIAQGEIGRITELNAKERRELIDAVAGIKEFEDKKEEANKELDKVNIKIGEAQGIFQERFNFLKELEKEKETAEAYISLTKRLKQLNYSIILVRASAIKAAKEAYEKELASLALQKQEAEKQNVKLQEELTKVNAEKQEITNRIEETSKSMAETNAKLQEIAAKIASDDTQISNYANSIANYEKELEELAKEKDELDRAINENIERIEKENEELEKLEKGIKAESVASPNEIKELSDKVAEREKELQEMEKGSDKAKEELARLNAQREMLKKAIEEANGELASVKAEKEAEENEKRALESKNKEERARFEELTKRMKEVSTRLNDLYSIQIQLKEQRAMAEPKENAIKEKIASNFSENDGYYGTIGDLCTYDMQYANAVEASAGNRLNYFVVDSIETANKIIEFLRRNSIGRATFIPLKDIRGQKETRIPGLVSIIEKISFDKKFENAFEFVFGNTYLVESIEKAKSSGIGAARYVTLEGDLVEPSGLVSGGYRQARPSAALLDKQLQQVNTEIQQLLEEQKNIDNELFDIRKELASADAESHLHEQNLAKIEAQERALSEKIEEISSQFSELSKLQSQAEESLKAYSEKRENLEKELQEIRARLQAEYEKASASASGEEAEAEKRVKQEIEGRKIRIAELRKENEMREERKRKAELEIKEIQSKMAKDSELLEKIKKEKEQLMEEREKIEEGIKNGDSAARELYTRLNELDGLAVKLSGESGELTTKIKELDSRISDIQVKNGQLEVRLSDLNAELAAYENGIEPIEGDPDQMEKEAEVINSKIRDLGVVNLKAPEIYEEKKKEVEEVKNKLDVLEGERQAVINLIEEIDKKKLDTFITTFNEVNKNFSKMYNYIFPGSAQLVLEDPQNPFNGGLEIRITGTNTGRLASLSGGEKALVSLMLIFAIHMYKPSGIYIFDEIDASLDKENSKKLSQLIKQLSQNSQFIVVSHNDSLILNADAAIGVVKSNGESKAVGIEISSINEKRNTVQKQDGQRE